MEILIGLVLAILGIPLLVFGILMFIKSDGWLFFTKALLVILIGLLLSTTSFVFLSDGFGF